jgi:undecaprenyl diphosphate synthase
MKETDTTRGLHVGFIMDGNGRFATSSGNPRLYGHTEGIEAVKRVVRACPQLGITTMSLFAFAIANWKRDKEEVEGLWRLFKLFFERDAEELLSSGVRVRVIGDKDGIPEDVRTLIDDIEDRSKMNTTLLLQIALNYDGLDEVVRAFRKMATEVASGVRPADSIGADEVMSALDTNDAPVLDVVIRTGMQEADPEHGLSIWRSSAFMPLQALQAVCVSSTVLWPAITVEHVKEALVYARPEDRLFGGQRKEA